jgi:peroxiredoxin Q/BCP
VLGAGDRAPEFSLPDDAGTPVSLKSLLHQGPLILYFYPGDFTPVCTREACMVRDLHGELAAAGLAVAGVSPDSPEKHRLFKERHHLEHTLLADQDRRVIRTYGVEGFLKFGVRRASFLIDPSGLIRDVVRADLRVGRHEEFLRRAILLRDELRQAR